MNTQSNSSEAVVLPRRSLTPLLIPIGVLLCMIAMIAWSAWPVVRPSRTIDVTQAIMVPTNNLNNESSSVRTGTLSSKSVRTVQAAGWLEAEPYIIAATALADGVIEEMLVLEGDRVEKGQILAKMVAEDSILRLARANAELAAAQASLEMAEVALTASQHNWEEPFELTRAVASEKALLQERRAELTQLPSLIRTERALLLKAQEELKSIEQAYQSNAAAEIEYISARELVNAQSARLDTIMARELILNAATARLEAELHAAQVALDLRIDDRERLDAAKARVHLSQAEVARREALRDEAQLEFDRMTIRAPITGYVQSRLKAPGDKVIRMMDTLYSAHIVHLYDPAKLQVRVDVPLADASQISVGQPCEVVVEVLPDQVFTGEVLIVTHEADLQKNTLQVKVRVIDPDPILRPEMLTRVKFLSTSGSSQREEATGLTAKSTVRLPSTAIDLSSDTPRVWVVAERANGRGVLRPIPISRLSEEEGWVTVEGDLYPGSIIASTPVGCTAGERVRLNTRKEGV